MMIEHGDRLAERAAEAEHRGRDDAGAAERQHRGPDHLPAGRAEGERRLLVRGGVWGKTSRLSAVTIGRIMIERITDPAKIEFGIAASLRTAGSSRARR